MDVITFYKKLMDSKAHCSALITRKILVNHIPIDIIKLKFAVLTSKETPVRFIAFVIYTYIIPN